MRDNLFNANIDIADFRFDKEVVEVFDDMVRRSVPGYDSMIQMIGLIARMYGQDNTNYYDLGSSTGAISLAIALNNKHQKNTFFAIDNSEEMVSKCKQNLESKIDNLQATCADINQIHIENASSELEIANKRQAIENVLITDTKAIHIERLKDSGFKDTSCFFQCLNFVSFLSVK